MDKKLIIFVAKGALGSGVKKKLLSKYYDEI